MNILEDTLRLVTSWRAYWPLAASDERYARLVHDLAMVIRSRIKR